MEKVCKNCRFWKRMTKMELCPDLIKSLKSKLSITKEKELRNACGEIYHVGVLIPDSPVGECSNENFVYTAAGGDQGDDLIKALKNPTSLLYSDGEAYQAYFLPTEYFGCVHFKENDH